MKASLGGYTQRCIKCKTDGWVVQTKTNTCSSKPMVYILIRLFLLSWPVMLI